MIQPDSRRRDPAVPPVERVDELDEAACVAALRPLFEDAPAFLERLVAVRPFRTAGTMFSRARDVAHAMPEADQVALVDAHPRLGAPPADVSALSFREQGYDAPGGQAGGSRLARELDELNAAYEARFGFRYCVFVAGRPREALLPDMRAALDADRSAELARAIDAVVDIAADRYRKLTGRGLT